MKAAGRLVTRHEHAHLHASIDLPVLTPEESFFEWIQKTRMRLFTLSPEERARFRRETDVPDVSQMLPKDRVLDVAGEVV